jgi:hypothetical protein
LFVVNIAQAANVATSDVTNQAQAKKWHILLDMNHQPAVRDDQFTVTDFTLFFDYQLNPKNSLRILQGPRKNYEIGGTRGENDWEASDTILSHFWNLPWNVEATGTRFRLVNVVNLPTSIESQDNKKILTFGQTLQINTMIAGKFLVSVRPFYRYNWYKYNVTGPGELGGRPLPLLLYGVNMVNSYNVTDNFSLNATFAFSVIHESASEFDNSTNLGGWLEENPSGRYSMDLSANYSFTDKVGGYLGYSQGDNYLIDGRFEMFTYDGLLTRYSAGLTLYF